MSTQSTRFSRSKEGLTTTSSAATTDAIIISEAASGQISLSSGFEGRLLTWWATTKENGVFFPAQDAAGSAVTQVVDVSKAFPIPAILFGAYAIKPVSDADDASMAVSLKS